MFKKYFFIMLLALITTLPASANDTAFGGEGAAPMPIKQNNVVMLKEHIVITGYEIDRADMKGKWQVDCEYIFKNTTNSTLSFQMGFPFPANEEDGDITTPKGYTSTKGSPLVYDFKVTINGKPVTATKQKIASVPGSDMNYQEAYLWPITIKPHQTVNIKHHYITGVTINSVGQNYVSFVLKTGGLWQDGNIGLAILEVIPNTPTRMCSELDTTADYLKPTPPGVMVSGSGKDRKYRWELKQFQPKDELQLCLITAKNYVRYYVVNSILQNSGYNNINIKTMSKTELRLLKNSIYAQYGRQFSDQTLQHYFNQQWWYQPNLNYSDDLLTEEDKKAIAVIAAQENKNT